MQLSKPIKIVIGIATTLYALLPFLIMVPFFIFFFPIAMSRGEPDPAFMLPFMAIAFPAMFILIFLQFGLLIFYFIHVIKNRAGSDVLRILLGLGNMLMPYFSMPIYFLIFIWPETPPEWALQPPPDEVALEMRGRLDSQ